MNPAFSQTGRGESSPGPPSFTETAVYPINGKLSFVNTLSAAASLAIGTLFIYPWSAPEAHQAPRARIDVSRLGPQVGERVPDFSLLDQAGRMRTLDSIMGPRGAMLVFIRSADW